MGYPVSVSIGSPDQAELVRLVPHGQVGRVDLLLRTSDVPRAYDTALTAQMKKTLREAEQQMAHGRRAVLAKKGEGKDSGPRAGDALAIGQGESSYVIDENALTELPKKE